MGRPHRITESTTIGEQRFSKGDHEPDDDRTAPRHLIGGCKRWLKTDRHGILWGMRISSSGHQRTEMDADDEISISEAGLGYQGTRLILVDILYHTK